MSIEYRECIVYISDSDKLKATFHQWTNDGFGIVEFDDGKCSIVNPDQITFKQPITFDYTE